MPSTLLIYSSYISNKIDVIDIESKRKLMTFDGVQLKAGILRFTKSYLINSFLLLVGSGWTCVKEISNARLLVSLHRAPNESVNMEIFDLSRKEKAMKIYCFEEVLGGKHLFSYLILE